MPPLLRKRDLWLILLLAALAGAILWLLPALQPKASPQAELYIRYSINGGPPTTLPLAQQQELPIRQENGMENTLRLWPGGVAMAYSNCYNQLCVHQGEVRPDNMGDRPLQHMIVCAPHRLVVELVTAQKAEGDSHESP